MENKRYAWTIEHVLPQGENLPRSGSRPWGGDRARDAQDRMAHTLGNLTTSGCNSNLGSKAFQDKKERVASNGSPVGCRNHLPLNKDVVGAERWTEVEIQQRTDRLAEEVVSLFRL